MIVVGTAGHIDHGKTTMVRTLTGIETDRLKEEQLRGISIELGFAYLDLPDRTRIGLIDVPGHERFVHHMIAGATGVDIVLLVIAADEGVMPQTREHVAICELLGMKSGLVVISKVDLVEHDWLELVKDDVRSYLADTFLAGAPILEFSSVWSTEQVEEFRGLLYDAIGRLRGGVEKTALARPLLMPVDRVFTIKGFGTVVTGTVQSGTLHAGDTVCILPSGKQTKVRRIENHGAPAELSTAGTRTAANLPDVETGDVERGNVLASPGAVRPLEQFSGLLKTVSRLTVRLKEQFKALLHVGSAMVEASVRLLDRPSIGPDEESLVSVRLGTPVAFLPGSRFILRGFSAVADYGKTIGGGAVLWPTGLKARPEILQHLARMSSPEPGDVMEAVAFLSGLKGFPLADLPYISPRPAGALERAVEAREPPRPLVRLEIGAESFVFHEEMIALYRLKIREALAAHHAQFPRQKGMKREELKSRLPPHLGRDVAQAVAAAMEREAALAGDELVVSLASHRPSLDDRFAARLKQVTALLDSGGMSPPLKEAVMEQVGLEEKEMSELLGHMVENGAAVRIASDLYMSAKAVAEAREKLKAFLTSHKVISTQELKDLFGLSRKYLIPLGEYFDASKLTVRVGATERKLRGGQ